MLLLKDGMQFIQFICIAGVFIVRGKEDVLATLNLVPGESVYGEKRVAVEVGYGTLLIWKVQNPYLN